MVLPPPPRPSLVTLTLSEETKTTCARMLATARQEVPLAEFGIEQVKIRKGMTRSITLEVPGDKETEKAPWIRPR